MASSTSPSPCSVCPTDQIIEHMHSYINRLMTKSFYKLKDWLSEKASKKQHKGILKINAFSVKIKNNSLLQSWHQSIQILYINCMQVSQFGFLKYKVFCAQGHREMCAILLLCWAEICCVKQRSATTVQWLSIRENTDGLTEILRNGLTEMA